jgi:membrane protease YdiL (CAAX protease family)
VRAVWRALAFVLLNVVLVFVLAFLTPRGWLLALVHDGRLSPAFVTLNELLLLLPTISATAIMLWLEGRPFIACGLGGERPLARLLAGFGAGLVLISSIVLLVFATGHAGIGWGGLGAGQVLLFGLAWAGASLLTGFAEELALRGYLLQSLQRGLGFWPALVITTLLFAALHISNSGEGLIGIISVAFGGAILALGVRGTGSLWWSIGLHGAWDYAENFVWGVPDSGQLCAGTLLHTTALGPAWLSGGATGPEGSALALPLLALALALSWRAFAPSRI